jgi:hypothetical protein
MPLERSELERQLTGGDLGEYPQSRPRRGSKIANACLEIGATWPFGRLHHVSVRSERFGAQWARNDLSRAIAVHRKGAITIDLNHYK